MKLPLSPHRLRVSTRPLLLVAAVAATLSVTAVGAASAKPAYRRADLPIDQRIDDLLQRMTLEEKVAQLGAVWESKPQIMDAKGRFDAAKASRHLPNGIGQISRPYDYRGLSEAATTPNRGVVETVEFVNAAQQWATQKTRLGIPVLFHSEALHGYSAPGATSFPQAIALASSFDPPMVQRVFNVVGREVRAAGSHLMLAPVVDVARDPRWGRIEETYGEDPYLVAEMGVAAVLGAQGERLPLAPGKVLTTLKHMAGHGQPESGTNVGPAMFGERLLRDVFLYPFEQVTRRTSVGAVMASYNEIDGVPSHVNRWMLTDVLRGEWGFKGAVVSDYYAVTELVSRHKVAADSGQAAAMSLHAGVDNEMPDLKEFIALPAQVNAGKVSMADIDIAVRRMLRLKFEAGLFENPYADARAASALLSNADARALATDTARRTIVLLKNDGLLPLDRNAIKRLAVIGPHVHEALLGGYSDVPRHQVSLLQGIKTKLAGRVEVLHAPGVQITDTRNDGINEVKLADPQRNRELIRQAVDVARTADVIVLGIGDNENTSREGWDDNHLGDRSDITLVGQQQELADALLALGKPLVVMLINGKPLAITDLAQKAPAIIEAWYPGQEGGTAMADVLFGDVNPGGKLPVTFARSVGQLPTYYGQKPTAHRGYLFDTAEPLYPFGWGLSYTRFQIGAPQLSAARIRVGDGVSVTVDVSNVGDRTGDEVLQVYLHDVVSTVTRPVKELKGFQRVTLKPGERRSVRIELLPEAFAHTGLDMKRVVEPGMFKVLVGPNSRDLQAVDLHVDPA